MKEVIYLAVTRSRVERMTKNLPDLKRGEIPVKINLVVDEAAFREPVLELAIHIADWREGLVFPDPELRDGIITETEADMIRGQRLRELRAALESRGFTVTEPPAEGE